MGRHLTVSEQWGYTAPLRWAARPAGQAPLSRHIPEQVRRAGHYGHTDTCTRSKGSACLTVKTFAFETAVARPAAWNWVYPGGLFWAGVWAVVVPGPPGGSAGRGVKFRHQKVKWLTQTLPSELPSSRQRAVLCPLACTWNASKRVGWGPQGARLA